VTHSSLSTRHSSRLELVLVVLLLLLAFFFRTYELTGLGLGLEHDEVAEWQIANNIRHGEHALFFKEAYGQEPLFLYLMAGSTVLIGDNVFAIRFTSVFVAMLTLAASYRLLRRMFSPTVALVALAGLSIALWPVFWGRVGLRAMTLPLMLALGFDWLWRGLTKDEGGRRKDENKGRPFVLAGIFFGLSAYTYLSSRALPILLAIFTVYLVLFARQKMRGKWRGLLVSFSIAGVLALPLVVTILTQPDLQFRVSEVSAPLDKALRGETTEVAVNVGRAFGMFTTQGDSTVRDNWPDRPVFPEMIGQWLFLGGVIVAFTRFRQPRYVLALLWIGVMLIPSIVTTGAPNFTRTLGALPMVFAMPGIAVEALLFWAPRLFPLQYYQSASRVTTATIWLGLIVVLGINAASTYEDYFIKWPQHPETQFVFQADFAAIAKDIDASDVQAVAVGGLSNDTMDSSSLDLLLQRKNVWVRWFDSGSPLSSGGAILLPLGPGERVYIPSIVPVAPSLLPREDMRNVFQNDHFLKFDPIDLPLLVSDARYFFRAAAFLPEGTRLPQRVTAGSNLQFISQWAELWPATAPRRIFVHLVDPATGKPIAQHDGLDSPPRFWRYGDRLFQLHRLLIPESTPPGKYELWLGLYDPTTNARISQTDRPATEPARDHVVLGAVEVTR
jgi:4-amino-4-deoxy-L-arabinose transferase-like glycosyltransferase